MGARSISVIIVSHNVWPLLARCLRSIPEGTDVVVVDNASDDASAAKVKEHFPKVCCVPQQENIGFSAAVNLAAHKAQGDAFLLLNPDTELSLGALEKMRTALNASPDAAALGFRQIDEHGVFQLAVGASPHLVLEGMRRWVQRRLDRGDRKTARLLDRWLSSRRSVTWVAGSSLLVRRKDFWAVNGFDARFFLFFEDIDFCLRLRQNTHRKIIYDPSITVTHHRGASAKKSPALSKQAYRNSQILFWQLHRPWLEARLVRQYVRWRQHKT